MRTTYPPTQLRYLRLLPGLALLAGACGEDKDQQECSNDPGVLCAWAGDGEAAFDGDGHALMESSFYWPIDITFSSQGTFIVDWNNHRVRRVTEAGTLQTVMGTDFVGDGPEDLSDLMQPGAPGTSVHLNHPTQFVPLPDGTFIAVTWHNHKLRHYDPATGLVYVSCGRGAGFRGDGGPASLALLDQPQTISLRPDGGIYILDQRNQVIRLIDAAGIISTVVGTPRVAGFAGDGGAPLTVMMAQPAGSNPPPGGGMALDNDGRLYFSDVLNHRVRRVDFAANVVETVVGTGEAGFGGDGGPGSAALLNNPRKLAFGPDARLYIADELNNRIRAFDPATGIITTVVGNGNAEDSGDNGPAVDAGINRPAGVAFDGEHMYVLDTYNHRIRRVRL